MVTPWLSSRFWFPDPRAADRGPGRQGLVALGGDLSSERLVLAYRSGIFPWSEDPISWWSPDPRGILPLDGLHISKSLAKAMRREPFEVTVDRAFDRVMEGCAEPRGNGESTWITRGFFEAYGRLYREGRAHSVECWRGGELVGGIYGVAAGALFAGESMFHRADDASKIALVMLARLLAQKGFRLFDVQMVTPATSALGAVAIPRAEYLERLAVAVAEPDRWG